MNSTHILIYRPVRKTELSSTPVEIDACTLPKLEVSRAADLGPSRFPISFEAALTQLEETFAAYTEGDGSFGFAGESGAYRMSGTVYESGGEVESLDVWVDKLPPQVFDQWTRLFCDSPSELIFGLPNHNLHTTLEGICQLLASQ